MANKAVQDAWYILSLKNNFNKRKQTRPQQSTDKDKLIRCSESDIEHFLDYILNKAEIDWTSKVDVVISNAIFAEYCEEHEDFFKDEDTIVYYELIFDVLNDVLIHLLPWKGDEKPEPWEMGEIMGYFWKTPTTEEIKEETLKRMKQFILKKRDTYETEDPTFDNDHKDYLFDVDVKEISKNMLKT
eukprot:UN03256